MDKFVIIDGNNLMFRAFYALPQMANFDGEISNGVFGFTNMLVKIIKEIEPKYIAVTFDIAKKNFRHEQFAEYKGTRKPTPVELVSQFPIVKELLKRMNIQVVEKEGLEADDLMGCLSRMFDTHNIIVSADRDAFQLINDNTEILFPKKGITETINLNKDNLKEFYGVEPTQVIDLKSLMGDTSDNIPGVSGVGEKKALQLIGDYGTLDGVYSNIDKITGKLKENLLNDKDRAYLSQYLATIVTNEKLPYTLSDFEYSYPFGQDVYEMFKRYQFNSLLKKEELFDSAIEVKKLDVKHNIVDSDEKLIELIDKLKAAEEFALYIDNDNFNIYVGEEYQINFSKDLFSIGISFDRAIELLKPILENKDIAKTVLDYKALKHTLSRYNIELSGVKFDCLIARYLINSLAKANVDLSTIMYECGIDTKSYGYALEQIRLKYYAKMQEMSLESLYYDIELPLVDVLYAMEKEGFKVDRTELQRMEEKYRTEINSIEKEIFELIGKKFNLSSPKQLAEVLFDELGINIASNKKRSTSIEVLQEIENRHPVVSLIIKWRGYSKLYSTYIIGLENVLDTNDKIHTMFNQTLTATGRLSSSEPNLQNIPVRSEEGREIRKMFVSSFKDGLICSADYSQIELRLLANFSDDETMIEAFNNGQDIHAKTASEIFGIPLEMVDSARRRDAKAINFGIVYGISDFGLSQNIGITRKEASNYIKMYFERYPKIDNYLKGNVEFANNNGYVRTLYGRVRPIPEIKSNNHNLRTFGERVAMNMPLQGSASDIIKLAMIRIHNKLKEENLKSKMLVQVHDELVLDVYPGELEDVKRILISGMESVVDLKVKLTVNVESGRTWFEAK